MRSTISKRDAGSYLDNNPNQSPVWPVYVIKSRWEVNDDAQISVNDRDSDYGAPFILFKFANLGGCTERRIYERSAREQLGYQSATLPKSGSLLKALSTMS
jgi:hypothetical protein